MNTTEAGAEVTFEQRQVAVLQQLTSELPLNDYGLPIGFYRTDILPWHEHSPTDTYTEDTSQPNEHNEPSIRGNAGTLVLLDDDEPDQTAGSEELQLADDILSGSLNDAEEETSPTTKPALIKDHRIAGFLTSALESAFIWMNYNEGFPALPNGKPFWDNLDFEPPEAYSVFTRYLQMHQGREAVIDDEDDLGEAASGIRSISTLAADLHSDKDLLAKVDQYQMYYHLYYWGLRAKSYDVFRVAQHRRQQEVRAIEVEDSHFITSNRLMNKLSKYMDDDEEFWDMMTPKTAIDMFKTLTQIQRISAGLPAAGPASKEEGKRSTNQSFGMILKQVAQENNIEVGTQKEKSTLMERIQKDPEAIAQLQALIIDMEE